MKCDPKDLAVIRRLPPFSWLNEAHWSSIQPKLHHRTCPARALIVQPGEAADGLYILLSGRVQVVYEDSEGREFISRFVGPHDFFGELALFDDEECLASVRSTEPCELIYMPRCVVLECLATDARAAMCMLQAVTKRLSRCERKLAHLALNGVYERVAAVLLENARETHSGLLVQVGSEQIAGLVGASREMVSRVVAKMVQEGVVRKHKRTVTIVDRRALAQKSGHIGFNLQPQIARDPPTRFSGLQNARAVHQATELP